MTSNETDKKLFELCKPTGVEKRGENIVRRFSEIECIPWTPSTNWADLEPEVVRVCKQKNIDLEAVLDCGEQWDVWFSPNYNDLEEKLRTRTNSKAVTLCEAASIALIQLLESKTV